MTLRPRPRRRPPAGSPRARRRAGAALVEFAVCLPVFALFLAALMEINHAYMVAATLRSAAQQAGRLAVVEGVSTSEVVAEAERIAGSAMKADRVRVLVKDASAFDNGADGESVDFASLPDLDLRRARPRQLFVVRLEVPYEDVSLLPPMFLKDADGSPMTVHGQAVNRHE